MIPYLHKRQAMALAREYGFSVQAIKIVGQTAQWTDWHYWTKCIPNAATPSNPKSGEPTDPQAAAEACSTLLRQYLHNIQTRPLNEKLTWLGFAIHIIQDLAVHKGMRDEEHSIRTLSIILNPDWDMRGYANARVMLRRCMDTLKAKMGQAAFDEFCLAAGARLLTLQERERLFGPVDFVIRSSVVWLFQKIYRYIFVTKAPRNIRWDVERVLEEGLR